MKRTALNMMLTLVCTAVLAAVAVAALGTNLMTAKIPFDFNIGSQRLPAGTYTVSRANAAGVLIVRNDQTAKSVAVITNAGQRSTPNEKAQLDFRRYGDQYFLSSVKQAFTGNYFEAPKSRRERETAEAAKNLARHQAVPETVTITVE
ncbi:MAG: hypothetical protein HYR56_21820 [Acidobacteria bacterium]|nr:hypothetical protein [Acidobacteriota bacterium]MBI3423066.1 hypothetical protein [Acidobacteriota bacterium]